MKILKILIYTFILLFYSVEANDKLMNFNFGLISDSINLYTQKDMKISMDIWMKEVTKDMGSVNMVIYNKPQEAVVDLKNGKIDYVSAFPITFVKYFDISELQGGFTGRFKDYNKNKFVILIKKNQNIKTVKDLKNVKVGIQKDDEIMHIYTELNIQYSKIIDYSYRSKVLLDLFFSKIDVAIVPLSTFDLATDLNPQIRQRIEILKFTKFTSHSLGYYRKDIAKKDIDSIYNKGLKVFSTPRGKQMMDIYKIETLVHTQVSELDNAKELYNKYKKLKGKKLK